MQRILYKPLMHFEPRLICQRNFAGVIGPPDSVSQMRFEEWRKTLDVNCDGVMLCTKHELLQMMKQDAVEL
jgi:NADP-dependent 3-hydroxy acid dehydrogenase YdfG